MSDASDAVAERHDPRAAPSTPSTAASTQRAARRAAAASSARPPPLELDAVDSGGARPLGAFARSSIADRRPSTAGVDSASRRNSRAAARVARLDVRLSNGPRGSRTCGKSKRCASAARQRVSAVQRRSVSAVRSNSASARAHTASGSSASSTSRSARSASPSSDSGEPPRHQTSGRQAGQAQRRDGVVQVARRQPVERNRVSRSRAPRGDGLRPLGDQDGADADARRAARARRPLRRAARAGRRR